MAEIETVTKGRFATILGVSPGRVTQMIAEGKIGRDALEGAGRDQRVRVEIARRQIREFTDLGQRFGNGIATRLEDDDAPTPAMLPRGDPIADSIKAEKLRQLQYANRKAAEEELERTGRYVRSDQTAAAMARLAASLLGVFEGALGDFAQAIAGKFELPPRDALHLLRTEFRAVRVKAATAARRHAETLIAQVDDEVAAATDPALGEA